MKYLLILSVCLSVFSCNFNKSGKALGESASEFVEGVSDGVKTTFENQLVISDPLKNKGIETGKVLIENDSLGHSLNVVTVYMIFSKDFNSKITAKVEDKNGNESGRLIKEVKAKSGEAKYVDFVFDGRTEIDAKSKITMD